MNLLLDTHLILWFANLAPELTVSRRAWIEDPGNQIHFSVISLWEIVIKGAQGRPDFAVDAAVLRSGLLSQGFIELALKAEHVLQVARLPAIHRDPFDRALVAQAQNEGLILLTADATVATYPGQIRKV